MQRAMAVVPVPECKVATFRYIMVAVPAMEMVNAEFGTAFCYGMC
jgi:hypothetical protein